MDSARKFVDKGQIDKAVKEYLRIVKEDPKDVRVWLKIGDLYAKQGSKQDASETYLKVARFYEDQGFAEKAVAVYKQVLKLDPRLVDINLKLADLYRAAGKQAEAMQYFEAVAGHFHREGNTKEALATVRKVVELDPENIATRIKLAELYSKENMVAEAVTEFVLACDQLRRQNRPEDFLKVAERLLWHNPENHALNRELAALYLQRKDPRRALQKLQASFKADARDVETLGLLAQAFFALDQKAKTVSVLKELAKIHIENKAREKAAEVFRKVLEFVPTDDEALSFLGRATTAAAPPVTNNGTGNTAAAVGLGRNVVPSPPSGSPRVTPLTPATPSTPSPAVNYARGAVPAAPAAKPKFNITGELPSMDNGVRATGATPLIDEKSFSGDAFALPEYEDADDNDGNYSAALKDGSDVRGYSSLDAQAEEHSEEILKVLAESDVYVKYGLHQKAIDHLRRVFSLDSRNVEARERLKDILMSQGRQSEAQDELLRLAEAVVLSDARRAEDYLREILAVDGTHAAALDLARRNRLRVGRLGSDGGPMARQADDLGDFQGELGAPPRALGVARLRKDSVDDFDPHELIGGGAYGSPAPDLPPAPPRMAPGQHNFDLDYAGPPGVNRRQTGDAAASTVESYQSDEFEFDVDAVSGNSSNLIAAVEADLRHDELGDDIDHEEAEHMASFDTPTAQHSGADVPVTAEEFPDDLPFDRDEAKAFDAGVQNVKHGFAAAGAPGVGAARSVRGLSAVEFELGQSGETGVSERHPFDGIGEPSNAFAQGPQTRPGADQVPDATGLTHNVGGETRADIVATEVARAASIAADGRVGTATNLEDDLEEAEFYLSQLMYGDAAELLRGLLLRFPNHPLITAKLHEVAAMEAGEDPHAHADQEAPLLDAGGTGQMSIGFDGQPAMPGLRTEGISLEEIEEFDDDVAELEDDDDDDGDLPNDRNSRPSVMLENPVEDSDVSTHYDLGLAYKEMGLYEDAIKAFEKVLRMRQREVQCRLMIGMCQRDHGQPGEAVQQFKQGLHVPTLTELERQSLYYEIGLSYEMQGDHGEAVYYFEMVVKRDPGFADAAERMARLKRG